MASLPLLEQLHLVPPWFHHSRGKGMPDIPGSFRAKASPSRSLATTPPHPWNLFEPLCHEPPVSSAQQLNSLALFLSPGFPTCCSCSEGSSPRHDSPWLTCQCHGKAPGHPVPTSLPDAPATPQFPSWPPPHVSHYPTRYIFGFVVPISQPLPDASRLLYECLLSKWTEGDREQPI